MVLRPQQATEIFWIDASSSASTSPGRPRRERYWLLIERGDTEIYKTYPGLDEDLNITAEADAFVKWHAGQLTWAQATREGRIKLDGTPSLVRAFPTWNARSMFAHIKPVSRTPLASPSESQGGKNGAAENDRSSWMFVLTSKSRNVR